MIHIMMASYNGERYIEKQLKSILSQTIKDFVVYIQDDGSTDRTVEIIKNYEEKYPEHIRVLEDKGTKRKRGAKYNFASLFDKVPKAEYYMFCDQDDIWEKDKLELMLSRVPEKSENPFLLYCDMKIIDQEDQMLSRSFCVYSGLFMPKCKKEDLFKRILCYNFVTGAAMLFNDAFRAKIGKIPDSCQMHDWWLSLGITGFGGELEFLPEPLQSYRQHDVNVLGAFTTDRVKKKMTALFRIGKLLEFPGKIAEYKRNNQKMKEDRISQCLAFYHQYKAVLPERTKKELKEYVGMLRSKRKLWTLWKAFRKGYVFWSKGYTIKFYLL